MQHTTYSRQLVFIVGLLGLIFFGGGACFKTIEAVYWPVSNELGGGSETAGRSSSEKAHASNYALCDVIKKNNDRFRDPGQKMLGIGDEGESHAKKCWGNTCCQIQPSNDKDELLSNRFKDALLYVLDNREAFTKQKKRHIENVIHRFFPNIIELKDSGITLIEILEGILAQLGIDQAQGKWLGVAGDAQNLPNECAICLEGLKDNFTVLPCHPMHAFHNDCIKQWVNTQGPNLCRCWRKILYLYKRLPCPICRENFSPNGLGLISDYCWAPTL